MTSVILRTIGLQENPIPQSEKAGSTFSKKPPTAHLKITGHPPDVKLKAVAPITIGPMGCCIIYRLIDGSILIIPRTPLMIDSGEVARRALEEERIAQLKALKAEQNRKRVKNFRQREKDAKSNNKNQKQKQRRKPNPLRANTVWLLESEMKEWESLVDMKMERRQYTLEELREMNDRLLTAALRSGIKNIK